MSNSNRKVSVAFSQVLGISGRYLFQRTPNVLAYRFNDREIYTRISDNFARKRNAWSCSKSDAAAFFYRATIIAEFLIRKHDRGNAKTPTLKAIGDIQMALSRNVNTTRSRSPYVYPSPSKPLTYERRICFCSANPILHADSKQKRNN